MKKTVTLVLALMLGNLSYAQTERQSLKKGVLTPGSVLPAWEFTKIIENESDTSVYFHLGFNNEKYQYITDIGGFIISEEEDLQNFINGLSKLASKEKGVNMDLEVSGITLRIYDFSNSIYIEDRRDKYMTISKKEALKLAQSLQENKYLLKR